VQKNCKTCNALYCTLDANEFNRISTGETTIKVWNTLVTTYEGISEVKESKISIYIDVCEGGLKKDMKMKKEFKLEVHEAHGHKLKFQFNHLEPVYLNLELDRTKLTLWIQNHHQMQA